MKREPTTVDRLVIELQKLQHQGLGHLHVTYPYERSGQSTEHEVITEVNVSDGVYEFYDNGKTGCVVKSMTGKHVLLEWN